MRQLKPDFLLTVYREKIPGFGEDSFFCSSEGETVLAAALDGCGGAGARVYDSFRGHTGAYMASRAVCGAVRDEYLMHRSKRVEPETLKKRILQYMQLCKDHEGETIKLRGSMVKDYPTTLALLHAMTDNDQLQVRALWAGDSRCYALTAQGLMQLSADDLMGQDAMENLREDAPMCNMVSLSGDFAIRSKDYQFSGPCVLFAATDGCFNYYSTPMEFEMDLLDTLHRAETPAQWEDLLDERWSAISGDDYTLTGAVFGYGTFRDLKQALESRRMALEEQLLGLESADYEEKKRRWNVYRPMYYSLCSPNGPETGR